MERRRAKNVIARTASGPEQPAPGFGGTRLLQQPDAEQGRQHHADSLEGDRADDHLLPLGGRHGLGHVGGGRREIHADGDADQELAGQHPGHRVGEHEDEGGHGEERHVGEEHVLAPEPVGQMPAQHGAEHGTQHQGRAQEPDLERTHGELGAQQRHSEPGHEHGHPVHERTADRRQEQPSMDRAERRLVDRSGDAGHGGRRRSRHCPCPPPFSHHAITGRDARRGSRAALARRRAAAILGLRGCRRAGQWNGY